MDFTYWKMGAVIANFPTKCQLLEQHRKTFSSFNAAFRI